MADEKEYPYSTVPGRLAEVLQKIPAIGKPEKVTQDWLKGLGYSSGNDKSILSAMRKAGLVASGGTPTDFYDALRNRDKAKTAEHIRLAYRDLFGLYPDAHQKDDEALRNFFRSKTAGGDKVQRQMVRTFKVFCAEGDFGSPSSVPSVQTPDPRTTKQDDYRTTKTEDTAMRTASGGLTLNVNIQLQLPESAEGDVYEKLFAAMGKHLKGLANIE